ncbi:flagellar biosynthetic protein FliR [Massilia norwichensis]|uniref:Flagellar biosynthetic protein FliR n=1 Tax=Massilia norwichensis TaxID=1442366 RepID=A0ABT2A5I9_9BURK|nr:flagellar biosynthetic protein FliR [Massilia norwichensis]MCS0589457.1 flagellar biosynthetic protein FliR [Massilia norwichensis]
MISFTTTELYAWIGGLLWPLTRILGLVAAAPVFGNTGVPMLVKLSLGVLLSAIVAPTIPGIPAVDPTSWAGILILAQEMLIGAAMGFAMRLVFAAIEFAGEVASTTMGLGFATFFDPASAGRSSAIGQFLALVATMAFLAMNAHLVLIQALVESFYTLPISATPISLAAPLEMVRWGGRIFSAGLQIGMPIIAAMLITNVAMAILTRAAPQLNLFGIGFPITLGAGFLILSLTLPYLGTPLQNLFNQGIEASRRIPRTGGERPGQPM